MLIRHCDICDRKISCTSKYYKLVKVTQPEQIERDLDFCDTCLSEILKKSNKRDLDNRDTCLSGTLNKSNKCQ